MKFDYCKEHQGSDRADLNCRCIRNDDGTPATQKQIWTQLERMALAPIALMDTRIALGLCALAEEDFPALYALQGRRVALVDLGPNDGVQGLRSSPLE